MRLRALNRLGGEQFVEYLCALKDDPTRPAPFDLLLSDAYTTKVPSAPEIEFPPCETKLEVARYLVKVLGPVDDHILRTDLGIWSWLALRGFDLICPVDGRGNRKRLDIPKYVPGSGHFQGPRKHLLYLPWNLYSIHGGRADFLLMAPPSQERHEQREWGTYSYLALSHAAVEVCRRLFWQEERCALRHGAKSTKSGTSIRAYLRYISLFDETYDLHALNAEELLAMLPLRFQRLASTGVAAA